MARRTRVSRGTPARKKVWARQVNINAVVAAGPNEHFNADLLSPLRAQLGLDSAPPGLTVIRVRGSVTMVTAGEASMGLMGIRVYNRSAGNAGAALLAVEGPATDPHADWMTFVTIFDHPNEQATEFDVRSMRRLEELSQSLCISFQTPAEDGGSFRYSASVLLALP